MVPLVIENARLILAFTIPTGAPMTVANDTTEVQPAVTDKTINDLSKLSKETIELLRVLQLVLFLSSQQQNNL